MLAPRPNSTAYDFLAIFELQDGRVVYVRALSEYYSGSWDGFNVRVYVAEELQHLEQFAMGFKLAEIHDEMQQAQDSGNVLQCEIAQLWRCIEHAMMNNRDPGLFEFARLMYHCSGNTELDLRSFVSSAGTPSFHSGAWDGY